MTEIMYCVPGVLVATPLIGKLSAKGAHSPVVPPGLPRLPEGFEPLNALNVRDAMHPALLVTVSVTVKYPKLE